MAPNEIESEATTDLVTGLITDAKDLATGMQAELRQELANLKVTLLRVAVKVAMIIVAAVLVGHGLAWGIGALGIPMWAAYVLAAGILFGVGMAVLKRLAAKPAAEPAPELPSDIAHAVRP
jgi:uncharacterized membrane protein